MMFWCCNEKVQVHFSIMFNNIIHAFDIRCTSTLQRFSDECTLPLRFPSVNHSLYSARQTSNLRTSTWWLAPGRKTIFLYMQRHIFDSKGVRGASNWISSETIVDSQYRKWTWRHGASYNSHLNELVASLSFSCVYVCRSLQGGL